MRKETYKPCYQKMSRAISPALNILVVSMTGGRKAISPPGHDITVAAATYVPFTRSSSSSLFRQCCRIFPDSVVFLIKRIIDDDHLTAAHEPPQPQSLRFPCRLRLKSCHPSLSTHQKRLTSHLMSVPSRPPS